MTINNHESQPEISRPPEKKLSLDPALEFVINQGLNATISQLIGDSKGKTNSELDEILRKLSFIEEAVAPIDPKDPTTDTHQIREEYYDRFKDAHHIKLTLKDKIDPDRITENGSPALNLSPGKPVHECQITIKPFSPPYSSASGMDSQRKLEMSGYSVNVFVNQFLFKDGKVSVDRLAGIQLKVSLAGDTTASLRNYIGQTGFKQIGQTTLAQFNPDKTIAYLDTLGLSNPRHN